MRALKESCTTVGELKRRLASLADATPLYYGASNKAPCFTEMWNAEGECEGVDIMPGPKHGDE